MAASGLLHDSELAQLRAVRYLGAGTSLICRMLAQGTPFAIFSWFVLVQHEHLEARVVAQRVRQ